MSQNNLPQAQTKTHSLFDNFVNKYALSKTLRFELKPYEEEEGKSKTRRNLKKMTDINANSVFSNFLHDQEIEDSYQILKPVFDKIHEEFITNSLRSKEAKEMDFSEYFNLYLEWAKLKKEKANAGENEKDKIEMIII
jgi:CRISPR-associated protein Cpf1